MSVDENLWELEKRFWTEGADFYEGRLAADAVMVFPFPAGILRGDAIIDGLAGEPRWQTVEMSDQHIRREGVTASLAYLAKAWRDNDDPPYEALCASTYLLDGDDWRLMVHQQTPA